MGLQRDELKKLRYDYESSITMNRQELATKEDLSKAQAICIRLEDEVKLQMQNSKIELEAYV